MFSNRSNRPSALLLLPPLPSSSFHEFSDTYKPPLMAVCSKLCESVHGSNQKAVLDIALAIPDLLSISQSRAGAFPYLQHFLATIYKLVGIICSDANIELDLPGGIDARVVFIELAPVGSTPKPRHLSQYGPILDLKSLATSARPWSAVYFPDNSPGQNLAAAFRSHSSADMLPVPAGCEWTHSERSQAPGNIQPTQAHHSVAVGGTFDHFHIGHKLLLTATALALEPGPATESGPNQLLTVGVTVDELLANKKYAEYLESWDERCNSVAAFLTDIINFIPPDSRSISTQRVSESGPNGHYILMELRPGLFLKMVQISDPFGPTITDPNITALVVSHETSQGGAAVNTERAKKGFKSLDIFEVSLLYSGASSPTGIEKSFEAKISSTDMRKRQANLAKV